ncbi:NIPSNAP family protein [Paracoccus binzhouensis]|uniref:NIPSNAP family protein n=1 Tax=Paracoccus binzhouensis TaxID=2796149 RepID=UPI0018EF2DD2|nr:NIPSNAP family protein [Paracoccus binzhouensis]
MFTPPADRPLVNLRFYTIAPRRMAEFLELFDRLAMPVLLRSLGAPIGFYTSTVGPLNQVVHLWAYRDMADMEARWQARDSDPAFAEYLRASGHLIVAQEDRLLRAAALPSLAGPSGSPPAGGA